MVTQFQSIIKILDEVILFLFNMNFDKFIVISGDY
jgi:hypothetical protein